MKKKRTAHAAYLNLCISIGLAVFFFGLLLSMLGAASPQTPMRAHTRNLDAHVYPAGVTPTPTATPCAGAWTEQSPYPIVTSGQAVASVGGNVYSFGGIVNNTAITNAYKYT